MSSCILLRRKICRMVVQRCVVRLLCAAALTFSSVGSGGAQPLIHYDSGAPENLQSSVRRLDSLPSAVLRQLVQANLVLSNIYDSNIDQNTQNTRAYGYVPALRLRALSSLDDPLFTADYSIARHTYTNTDRWDRISQSLDVAFEPEIWDAVRTKTTAEVSFKGSWEDRDLSNQYELGQEIEYRVTRQHRLTLYGTYRYKWLPGNSLNNAFKPNVGAIFQRRMDNGERVIFDARFERNVEKVSEDNYSRWNYSAEYRTPTTARGMQFRVQTTFRSRVYDEKLVELDDEDYPRRDQQWTIEAELLQRLFRNVDLTLGYRHDNRNSNDPDKLFGADMLLVIMSYRLWN